MTGMPAVGCVLGKDHPIAPETHNLPQQVPFRTLADIGGEHVTEVALQVLVAHVAESLDTVGVQPPDKSPQIPKRVLNRRSEGLTGGQFPRVAVAARRC